MKIAKVLKKDEVPNRYDRGYGKSKQLVEEFLDSGAEAAEVDGEGKPIWAFYNALYQWTRKNRNHYPIVVSKIGDKVYIMRADEVKE